MKPDTFPKSSEENNPERIRYTDLIIKELACIEKAIEMIGRIIREYRSELNLSDKQIEKIRTSLTNLSSYALQEIKSSRIKIDWETIISEIQSYIKESEIYHLHLQGAFDSNLQLKTLLGYILERLMAAITHAGNLYNTQGTNYLIGELDKYKNEIYEIKNSLYGG
jgi:hypothetical protein